MLDDVPAPPEASEFDTNAARAFLAGLINRLPPRQRQAIKLVKLDELTVSEASARTGDTQSAIKLRIHRAIRSLQSTLEAARNAGSMMSMQDFAA
jgi:RNA polymerase sigma-70 factor (ECF subfamily)